MHVLKLVNKRKRSTRMPLLKDGAWISCDLRLGRWRHFQGGMPRPVVHAPIPWLHPHVKTVPQSEMCRNVKRKGENGMANSNLTETQNKSLQNLFFSCNTSFFFFAILFFCLQNLFFSRNTSFSFAILYFCLKNLFSSCNTSILLQIYTALFWLHTV